MRTTIDGAGRIVIPKPIREALGLAAGTEVDIDIDGVAIRIDAATRNERAVVEEGGLLVLESSGHTVTVDDVRRMRLDLQR